MPNRTYSPTPQNTSYNTGNVSVPTTQYSLNGGLNGFSAGDLAFGTIASTALVPTKPMMSMQLTGSSDVVLKFNSTESGHDVELTFAPDANIPFTIKDLTNIMFLMTMISNRVIMIPSDVMSYVRKHNLERHFQMKVA